MKSITDLGIVIAAGGSSARFGDDNKLFVKLDNKPVFIHSILEFVKVIPPKNIVITVPEYLISTFADMLAKEPSCSGVKVVSGGTTRTRSVRNGIKALGQHLSYVAIHDAARPLVSNKLLHDCYLSARTHKAAIPGKPVNDTLKRATLEGVIAETVDRSDLFAVETPQVFDLKILTEAYNEAESNNIEATDDAGIMEHMGYSPHIVISETLNVKITYADDVTIAQAYLMNHR